MHTNLYSTIRYYKISFIVVTFLLTFVSISKAQYQKIYAPVDTCYHEEVLHHTRVNWRKRDMSTQARIQTSTFEVSYKNFTPEAKTAFEYALQIWGSSIVSSVPIRISAEFETTSSTYLAYANPLYMHKDFSTNALANTTYPDALADAIAGKDLAPEAAYDIRIRFNDKYNWYFGTDLNPASNQFDFITIVLHEMGHGLGFNAHTNYSYSGEGTLQYYSTAPSVYSRLLTDAGNKQFTSYNDPSSALGTQFVSNNVKIRGVSTLQANNNEACKAYAPSTWKNGSSLIHLDEATYPAGTEHSLMTPRFGYAEAIHEVSPLIQAMLKDMGWPLSGADDTTPTEPTPDEPETPTPSDLRLADHPNAPVKGIQYDYYEGNFKSMPNFKRISPLAHGIQQDIRLLPKQPDAFAYQFEGFFYAPSDGYYNFYLDADQGAEVYLGSDLLLASGSKGKQQDQTTVNIGLEAGYHSLLIQYYEWKGNENLQVRFDNPQMSQSSIDGYLFYDAAPTSSSSAAMIDLEQAIALKVFPNPTSGALQLMIPSADESQRNVRIYNQLGVMVYEEKLAPELSQINIDKLAEGIYELEVMVGAKRYYSKIIKH